MAATSRLMLSLFFTAAAACGSSPNDAAYSVASVLPVSRVYSYRCQTGESITARFFGGRADLTTAAGTMTLTQTLAASGARYQSGSTILWTKGDEAMLTTRDGRQTSCVAQGDDQPWREAYDWSVDFHATGNAPIWWVEIDENKDIKFVTDYGARTLHMPTPQPQFRNDSTIYGARSGSHAVTLWIRNGTCHDRASGITYPFTVTATLDYKIYKGCGRRLP